MLEGADDEFFDLKASLANGAGEVQAELLNESYHSEHSRLLNLEICTRSHPTLDLEQCTKLYKLWNMVCEYLSYPYQGPCSAPDASKICRASLQRIEMGQENVVDRPFTPETIRENRLAMGLFRQLLVEDLDALLVRFLRARKWDVVAAFLMLIRCWVWRDDRSVDGLMYDGQGRVKRDLLEGGEVFLWKQDLQGRLVCYLRGRLHNKNAHTNEESMLYLLHTLETSRLLCASGQQTVSIVVDLAGAGLAAFDPSFIVLVVKCLQAYYPEILGKCLIVNAPWIFSNVWNAIKIIMDPNITSKVFFIKAGQLHEHIDPANIPTDFQGNDPFEFRYIVPCELPEEHRACPPEPLSLLDAERRFMETTRAVCTVLVCEARDGPGAQSPNHLWRTKQIMIERDRLKEQLRDQYYPLKRRALLSSPYHRIGVLDDQGRVDWDACKQPLVQ